jgi:hypothetical protein
MKLLRELQHAGVKSMELIKKSQWGQDNIFNTWLTNSILKLLGALPDQKSRFECL